MAVSDDNSIKDTLRNLRRPLDFSALDENQAPDDPLALFEAWMKDAIAQEPCEPNAMTLSTASVDGSPTSRTVLLKDYTPSGFTFYTNYDSRKGGNLTANPKASLALYWKSLSRQVLIDGDVIRTSREDSETYFHARPRGSQIAAYVSHQSRPVDNRSVLEKLVQEAEAQFKDKEVPCPDNWGGFCLKPIRIEFWQGRPDRTHDRICYTQTNGQWTRQRLAP